MGTTRIMNDEYEYMLSNLSTNEVTFNYRHAKDAGWTSRVGSIQGRALRMLQKYPGMINHIFKSNSRDGNIEHMPFQIIEFYIDGDRPEYNGSIISLVDEGKSNGVAYIKDSSWFCRIIREYGNWPIKNKYRSVMKKRKPMSSFSIDY